MSGYNIISDVTEAIIKILRAGMVPDIIPNTEAIGACHPSDKGDIVLGINLYDVKRNTDVVEMNGVPVGKNKMRSPSLYLDLYYMITAYSASDIRFRSIEEAKILGRAIQLLEGNSMLKGDILGKSAGLKYTPKLEFLELESEEKTRLWNIPEVPYKLSIFYKVYPVEIESLKISDITRVTHAEFDVEERQDG